TNPTVSPVEEHEPVAIETVISRMEVAVDQGVLQAAFVECVELGPQVADEFLEGFLLTRFQLGADIFASHQPWRFQHHRGPTPVRRAGRQYSGAACRHAALKDDE